MKTKLTSLSYRKRHHTRQDIVRGVHLCLQEGKQISTYGLGVHVLQIKTPWENSWRTMVANLVRSNLGRVLKYF